MPCDPLGIDTRRTPSVLADPQHCSWSQRQTAYQILVATSPRAIGRRIRETYGIPGNKYSDKTTFIPYQGQPLKSSQQVFWKVRAWDAEDQPSPWSRTATWTMGILRDEDWQAKWIVAPWMSEALLMRKDFSVRPGLRRAIAHMLWAGSL